MMQLSEANKIVHWDEPNCYGGNSHNTCTVEQAIKVCHEYAEKNHFRKLDDERALEEFLTIHWAWIEEN